MKNQNEDDVQHTLNVDNFPNRSESSMYNYQSNSSSIGNSEPMTQASSTTNRRPKAIGGKNDIILLIITFAFAMSGVWLSNRFFPPPTGIVSDVSKKWNDRITELEKQQLDLRDENKRLKKQLMQIQNEVEEINKKIQTVDTRQPVSQTGSQALSGTIGTTVQKHIAEANTLLSEKTKNWDARWDAVLKALESDYSTPQLDAKTGVPLNTPLKETLQTLYAIYIPYLNYMLVSGDSEQARDLISKLAQKNIEGSSTPRPLKPQQKQLLNQLVKHN